MRLLTFSFLGLLLVSAPISPSLVRAAEPSEAAADAARLAAFMEKWKSLKALNSPMAESDRPLVFAAFAKDPTGPWQAYVLAELAQARFELRDLSGTARQAAAFKTVRYVEQGVALLSKTPRKAGSGQTGQLKEFQAELDHALVHFLLESGLGLDRVRAIAQRMLDEDKDPQSWDHGNIIYQANEALGRVAVREQKFDEARARLRAAGRTPGSPQLNSFGPEFDLARELLEHGAPEDREAVLAFLDDVAKFWANPDALRKKDPPNQTSVMVAEYNLKDLNFWRREIRAGQIPSHRKWK